MELQVIKEPKENYHEISQDNQKQKLAKEAVTVDEALQELGGFGRFQLVVYVIGGGALIFGDYLIKTMMLFELEPQYECHNEKNMKWEECTSAQFCQDPSIEWRVNWDRKESLRNWYEEYDLYCAPSIKIALLGSIYFIAMLIGIILFSRFPDLYGRRRFAQAGTFIYCFACVGLLMSTSLEFTYGIIFVMGLVEVFRETAGYIFFTEFMIESHVSRLSAFCFFFDGLTLSFATLFSVTVSNYWKHLFTISTTILFILAFGYLWLPESPRYYYSTKQYDKLRDSLTKIGRFNKAIKGKYERTFKGEESDDSSIDNADESTMPQAEYTLRNLFRDSQLVKNLFIFVYLFLTTCFIYYMSQFYVKYIPGNIFTNSVVGSVAEGFGDLLGGMLMYKYGSKKAAAFVFFLCSGSAVMIIICEGVEMIPIIPVFVLGYKFGISAAYTIIYIAVLFYFPTPYMSTVFGICNLLGSVFSILSPLVAEIEGVFPLLSVSLMSFVAGIGCLNLVEESKQV